MTNTEMASASKVMLGSTLALAMYIGSTLMWQPSTPGRLPAGYTELEYIESSTNQYIDLNVKLYETLNTLYDIAMKFEYLGAGQDNTQPTVFGCLNQTNPWPGTFIRYNNNKVQGRYIGGTAKDNNLGNINEVIELTEKTSPNKNVTNLNNSGQTHNWSTSLFCALSNSSGAGFRFSKVKMYYFKLWVLGSLTRDMVPCKNSSNVIGLYDLVNDTFYSSPNGTAFIGGPTI